MPLRLGENAWLSQFYRESGKRSGGFMEDNTPHCMLRIENVSVIEGGALGLVLFDLIGTAFV